MYQAAGAQGAAPGTDPNAAGAQGAGEQQYYDADYTEVVDDDKK